MPWVTPSANIQAIQSAAALIYMKVIYEQSNFSHAVPPYTLYMNCAATELLHGGQVNFEL